MVPLMFISLGRKDLRKARLEVEDTRYYSSPGKNWWDLGKDSGREDKGNGQM